MTSTIKPRIITARRMLTLTTAAATAVVGISASAGPQNFDGWKPTKDFVVLAQATGGGEGEAGTAVSSGDPEQALQRDMSFMEGHMRAGLKLYEDGDLAAAKTHMGHPIAEKYGAVANPLADRGFGRLRQQIETVAAATEAEAPFAEVKDAFDAAHKTMEEVRSTMSPRDQIWGLSKLIRVAGDEYTVAVEGGTISNLHEYQDSWGFLRVVQAELKQMVASDDVAVAQAGTESLEFLEATNAAFGDIQGKGEMTLDPSILYGAAARIELKALGLPTQ